LSRSTVLPAIHVYNTNAKFRILILRTGFGNCQRQFPENAGIPPRTRRIPCPRRAGRESS
jgi:hypothetical protein